MRRHWVTMFVAVPLLALGLSACGDSDDDSGSEGDTGEAGTVGVTLRDFEIQLEGASAPAGEVTFAVHNDGPSVHEFVVFKTDLAADDLPTDENGDVAEGEDFEPVDEIEDIANGADPKLAVDLEAGKYVLICNIPGHYGEGMTTAFTVE